MKLFMVLAAICISPLHGQAPNTSLIELIASPQKFDGKVVRFHGVLNIGFESNAVYLSKEHCEHTITSCGIWLNISPKLAAERKWANGKYIFIEGTFNSSDRGHMGLWMGSLSKITTLTAHEVVTSTKPQQVNGRVIDEKVNRTRQTNSDGRAKRENEPHAPTNE